MPNWAEEVTAIATAVSAAGLLRAIGAVIFAGQQAREARIGRQAEMAVEFFRRWSEGPMLETRQMVAEFETPEALRDAMMTVHPPCGDAAPFFVVVASGNVGSWVISHGHRESEELRDQVNSLLREAALRVDANRGRGGGGAG